MTTATPWDTKTLTPLEYKELRELMQISKRTLAKALNVDLRTIDRRENGEIKIPFEAVLAITYCARMYLDDKKQ